MTIEIGTDPVSGQLTATFSIATTNAAAVSVVGSFNDWTPGAHTLQPAGEGRVAVTVIVAPGEDLHFRYLDSDGVWFDDPGADSINEHGSFVSATRVTIPEPALSIAELDPQTEQAPAPETVGVADLGSAPKEPNRRRGSKQRA
jgi:1,4-alpha-glucan branching enzyme